MSDKNKQVPAAGVPHVEDNPPADDPGAEPHVEEQKDGQATKPATPPNDPPADTPRFKIASVLKVTKPLIKGEDVAAVQEALIASGFGCGVDGANGVYNAATAFAVRQFQAMNRLIVSGRVEKFTATALGAEWEDPQSGTE